MRKNVLAVVLALFTLTAYSSVDVNVVDEYKVVFDTFPSHVPNPLITDAPLVGNGDIGVTIGSSQDSIRYYIGKNDFWRSIPSYPIGGLALPGGFDIKSDLMHDAKYYAEQLPGSARVNISYSSNKGNLMVGTWVSALDNKLVIELESTVNTTVELGLWAQEGGFSVCSSGVENGCKWVTRSFENVDNLLWPCHVAMAVNVPENKIELEANVKRVIVIAIYSNFDSSSWKRKAIDEACNCDLGKLKKDHDSWWNQFWNLSHVEFDDSFLEQYYYVSQYIFACSSREGKFSPGLFGPFITTDSPSWAGDYHLNYNYQSPYWDSYSSNHLSLTDNYDKPILESMNICKGYAQKMFGARGVLYPVGIGPEGLVCSSWPLDTTIMKKMYGNSDNKKDCGVMFWHQKTNASFAAANMLMRFYYTYDKSYAEKVYPFILACGDFWEDFITFENGTYQIVPDTFYEVSPWKDISEYKNTVTSLGLVKMTMKGLLDMSEFLGVDNQRREKWLDIISHLSPYPINSSNVPMTGEGSDDAPVSAGSFRIVAHGLILPAGVVGPNLDPEYTGLLLKEMAKWKNEISSGNDWFSSLGNGIETSYPAAVRCGYSAPVILQELRNRIKLQTYSNGWILQHGGGIETLSAVPMTINEMMLQSYEGIIRVFPNWDRSLNASFKSLRAYGAFLVSASISSKTISEVSLYSEKGRDCTIENPWPGENVFVKVDGRVVKKLSGSHISFATKQGTTYTLSK